MENNNIDDKWLIVYQGYLAQYKNDYAKDSYNDKLVLVTGDKKSPSIDVRKSYLCVANEENSIEIPIPDLWIEKIQIGNDTRSWTTRVLNLAKENGINISFGDDGKTVTIGIDKDTRDKIDSIDNKVEQAVYDAKVTELEASIGGKYTKPVGGIPAKDLAFKVATEEDVTNAISVVATDLNDKIDSKVGKDDLKSLTYTVNGVSKTFNGLSEATIPAIYAPNSAGSQGQLLQSTGGAALKWTNLSDIKEAIGFAKDLTGVLEATPEEFTYRPSAGNKSIRDEGAVIRRIKGNTTIWGQCCKNPYLELDKLYNKNQSNASYTNTNEALRITYNSVGNPQGFYFFSTQLGNLVKGHIYMVSIDARVSSGLNVELELYPNYDTVLVFHPNEEWNRYAALYTLTRNTFSSYYYVGINKSSTTTVNAGDYFEFRNAQFIDLTSIFGAGNEPQTYEEFKTIYPDIYPYCEPEIRNVKTTAIETVGFNQWDEEWELGAINSSGDPYNSANNIRSSNFIPVIGGATYYSEGGDCIIPCYDENKKFIPYNGETGAPVYFNSINVHNSTFVLPINARYIKFWMAKTYGSTYNNDICINLSHTGVRNREYEPYKKNTLLLPEIANYFPDGMNGIGNVYDEINAENAIQRIGFVDIGELEWYTGSQKHMFLAPIENAKPTIWNEVANAIMLPYTAVSRIEADTADMSFCVNNIYHVPDRVCLTNYNYVDAASFKAAMSGVYLYYELAEPEIRPILEPIQLVYDVEDFGTERAISPENSAPFRADIVYQFNAEGRIRDNGRNIERLETAFNSRFDYDGMKVHVVADGLLSSDDNYYYLPSSRKDSNLKYNLASEQFVIDSLPREVAQVLERKVGTIPQHLSPNILYEFSGSVTNLTIVSFNGRDDNYEDVWRVRCGLYEGVPINILPTILWENGIAPNPTEWGIYEFEFRKTPSADNNRILGKFKVYK